MKVLQWWEDKTNPAYETLAALLLRLFWAWPLGWSAIAVAGAGILLAWLASVTG